MEVSSMSPTCIPPGFRFHPTEEELVGYYLRKKINMINNNDQIQYNLNVIPDIDLCTMEPWDIQGKCRQGACNEQKEWYFFSHKGKKYPTGSRTNRATTAGFWKATGRDKAVLSKNLVIGMRKTIVFYQGRAPNGKKSDWIIHEYRLQGYEYGPPQEEGWVVCKAFKKTSPNQLSYTRFHHHNNPYDQLSLIPTKSSPPMPLQEFYNTDYKYTGHDYSVELLPEIDVSDYDHISVKEGLLTEWDNLEQLIEYQDIGEYAL